MKLTQKQLHDLINEEISGVLLERQNASLLEVSNPDELFETYPLSADDLVYFAKAYVTLSRDMRSVLDLVLSGHGESFADHEIEHLQDTLGGRHPGLDNILVDALKASSV